MNISRSTTPDGIVILTFDRPNSAANVFDRETLAELEAHVTALENDPRAAGVILTSAKPKIFIAGADLNAFGAPSGTGVPSGLSHGSSGEHGRNTPATNTGDTPVPLPALEQMVDHGHRVFTRLGRLPIPSVAAIRGVCLGGGFEVALACDWRVASTDKATKLGLPETQLGILPAWGGSTRLPKLIGLPAALGLILTGKQIVAQQALKAGAVDEITHPEYLLDVARGFVARGKRGEMPPRWLNTAPFSRLVAAKARRDVLAKTRGHYPAPLKAIEVCAAAAGKTQLEEGFALEKRGFLELVRTPECRNLLSVFFLQERAKKLQEGRARPPGMPKADGGPSGPALPARHIAVVGAGTMGAGIAQWASARGLPVKLKDVSPDALARGLYAIEKIYADAVKRRVFTLPEATAGLDRITPLHVDLPMQDVDLVVEAALEQLEVKQRIFRGLESLVRPDAVLATNTSALSIDAIAAGMARPERVVGLHFFNPVHRMQLVEIVRGPRTSPATLATALQFTKQIGKLPVIVKDSPGFLVNRILLPYMVEAVWLFTEGVPAAHIDKLMLDFGMPMGPLRLADEVGLDVAQHVAKDLERRLPSAVPINDTLEKMIAKGWLGKKSGRGFYVFNGKREKPAAAADLRFLQAAKPRVSDDATRRDRLVLVMINEASRVLEEGVVESPEDVDFGMIMGTGWAPFRGGPLRYADALGAAEIVRRLDALMHEIAPHFEPAPRLCELVRTGRGFYATALPEKTESDPGAPRDSHVDQPLVSPGGGPVGKRALSALPRETAGAR